MKAITVPEFQFFLSTIQDTYDVQVPIALHDGTRTLGGLNEGPLSLFGGKISRKPTSIFFSQQEKVLCDCKNKGIRMVLGPSKPFFVVGWTAQDLDCLEFLDQFFTTNFKDPVYTSKRKDSVVIGVSGKCGSHGEFLKIAGGKCDFELICDGKDFLVVPYTKKGKDLVKKIGSQCETASLNELQKTSNALSNEDSETLSKASGLIQNEKVPDEFWEEIADQCIACTACNLACPTCTCFDVVDSKSVECFKRHRMWDSCLLDGFQREASGHNPMGTEASRTRRRIHHKLVADQKRWGYFSCMLCGRCDDVCPTGIGIKAVTRLIVERFS